MITCRCSSWWYMRSYHGLQLVQYVQVESQKQIYWTPQYKMGQSLGQAAACKFKLHLHIVPCCCQKALPSNSTHISTYFYSLANHVKKKGGGRGGQKAVRSSIPGSHYSGTLSCTAGYSLLFFQIIIGPSNTSSI